ncbi:BatA domain-containing protein [Opitutaceae bacterium]
MSFLAPLFLFGALAIAAPFVFHLIRRTTKERTRFGSLMFLEPSPPRLTKRSRLEHLFLLLLRCLALALLAFAFARPFFQESSVQESEAGLPARTVVLIDASASMRRAGLWDAARERAADIFANTGPADQVAVMTFARGVTMVLNFEDWSAAEPGARRALAAERLAATTPGWEGTELGDAVVTAAEMLLDSDIANPGPRRIVLISDLQAGSRIDALSSFEWPQGVQLVLSGVTARSGTNASLQLIAEAADAEQNHAEPVVRVRVTNAADSQREQFSVGWDESGTGTGAPVGAVEIYVPPGQSRVISLPVGDLTRPRTTIVLTGDDEAFDNRVYINPPEKRQVRVSYLGSETATDSRQPLFFLQRALTGTARIDLSVVARAPAAAPAADEAGAALVFVTDPLPSASVAALRAQLQAGATVVVAPKSAEFGQTLAALLERPGLAMEDVKPSSYAILSDLDFRHPIFAPFADPRYSDFTKIYFWSYRRVDLAALPDHRVLARFDSGDPALVELAVGRGRLLLLTSGWAPADSQLAVSSKFVPLLYSMLELGGALPTAFVPYVVGDALPVPAGSGNTVTVTASDGTSAPIPAGARAYTGAVAPGRYRLEAGGPAVTYAVNLDSAESRLQVLSPDELEQLGLKIAPAEVDAAKAAERQIMLRGVETEGRQKLWRWFVVGALLILLIESGLAGFTARRAAPQGGPSS